MTRCITPRRTRRVFAPIDFAFVAKRGIALGVAIALVWGIGYLYGTVAGWDMHVACEKGTTEHPELC